MFKVKRYFVNNEKNLDLDNITICVTNVAGYIRFSKGFRGGVEEVCVIIICFSYIKLLIKYELQGRNKIRIC